MKTNAFRLITLLMLLVVCGIQNPAQAQKDKIYTEDDVLINEIDDENFVMFEADSMEELLSKVQTYAYNSSSNKIMSTSERMVGTTIDFKG